MINDSNSDRDNESDSDSDRDGNDPWMWQAGDLASRDEASMDLVYCTRQGNQGLYMQRTWVVL